MAAACVVAAVIAACWAPGVPGPYHFDDAITPLDDPASASLGAWWHMLARTLRPVTKLTYALEASLGFDSAAARHISSITLLVALALALAALVRAAAPTLGPYGAAAVAIVAAIHPIHGEAVLTAAGRSAVLSSLLIMLALYATARDAMRLAGVCLFAACLARETALAGVLPIIAVDVAMRERTLRERAHRLAPVIAAAAIAAAWIAWTPRYRELAEFSFGARPVAGSAIAQVAAIPRGLALFVRVDRLSIDHGEPLSHHIDVRFALGVALVALAAWLAVVAARRRSPALAAGSALWLAAVLPTQSIVPKLDAFTERPLSLAWCAVVLAVAGAIPERWIVARRRTLLVAAAAIVAALGVATVVRARLYGSTELALWEDAARKSETNARPYYNHALLLEDAGRYREARDEIRRAATLQPFDWQIDYARIRIEHEGAD